MRQFETNKYEENINNRENFNKLASNKSVHTKFSL